MAPAVSRVFLGDNGAGVHLLRINPTVRQLDADHLLVHLALAIHAHTQPERRELRLQPFLVSAENPRFLPEVVYLLVERHEHTARFQVDRHLRMRLELCSLFNLHEFPPISRWAVGALLDFVYQLTRNCTPQPDRLSILPRESQVSLA